MRELQLPDQDFHAYYAPLDDDSYDVVMNNAGFNYGKELSAEEKLKLHGTSPQPTLKGKAGGKGKIKGARKVAFSQDSGTSDGRFYLKSVNLKVKKVISSIWTRNK